METKDFFSLLKRRKGALILIMILFAAASLAVSFAQPLKYRAKSRLLIMQSNTGTDAYTIARSNEYVGGLITEIVPSGSFLQALGSSPYIFDRNYFSGSYKDSVKKWNETVTVTDSGDTGIINLEVYHTDPKEALEISQAIDQLIVSDQSPYRFDPNQVQISVIDQPVVSTLPVKPDVAANLGLGLLFGFLAGCSYIYIFPKKDKSKARISEVERHPLEDHRFLEGQKPSDNRRPEEYRRPESEERLHGDINNIL